MRELRRAKLRNAARRSACLTSLAALLLVAGCGARDLAAPSAAHPEPLAEQDTAMERVLAEHAREIDLLIADAEAAYGHLTQAEVIAALGQASLPSVDSLAGERRALAEATLSEAERTAILELLGAHQDVGANVGFRGRLLIDGDVLYAADDLLAQLQSEGAAAPAARVDKANIPLTFSAQDPTGMMPGGPPRPHQLAKVEDGQLLFWRPDVGRRYFIVVPDDLAPMLFYGVVLAARALEDAVQEDCIQSNFIVIHRHKYTSLPPMARALSSLIELASSTSACLDRADGCANSPRLAKLALTPEQSETRMRLGTYIGLETDYDSPRDADTLPDLTEDTARDVVLHELSHVIGFDHPQYTELEADLDASVARVPQSSQGTAATFAFPTASPLFAPEPSAEDERVLGRVYGPECGYVSDFRALGDVCSARSEELCLLHGGSCEAAVHADGARLERCRWHNFTEREPCLRYSAGRWETSNDAVPSTVFAGEAGACIVDTSALADCVEASFLRTDEPMAGRCCAQFGTGDPGLLFEAFSGDGAAYFCSDQSGLGDPVSGSWEFDTEDDAAVFTTLDAATGAGVPGWAVSSGDFVQELEQPSHLTVSNRRLRSGCLSTRVTSDDDGESGIVFNFRNAQNYYVFDALPNVRRRIRRVVNGVSSDLLVEPWTGGATWSSTVLSVCFGDGIHTFIDNRLSSRASVDGAVSFVGTGGRIGLWNDMNRGARHAYLRSHSLVEGYALLEGPAEPH